MSCVNPEAALRPATGTADLEASEIWLETATLHLVVMPERGRNLPTPADLRGAAGRGINGSGRHHLGGRIDEPLGTVAEPANLGDLAVMEGDLGPPAAPTRLVRRPCGS
jgi:hypothetical protein